MAVIYLKHPIHGECVFASELEANVARAAGWVSFEPVAAPPSPAVPDFLSVSAESIEEPEVPKVKRPKG